LGLGYPQALNGLLQRRQGSAGDLGLMRKPWLWCCLVVLLSGCATVVPPPEPVGVLASVNPRYGYRFSNLPKGPDNSDGIFMVLAFSGGGNRSAALAYGVLDKLRETTIQWEGRPRRLVDEVDVINSVSGGSYAAAYYGLFGDAFFTDFPGHFLNADFQTELWDHYVSMKGLSQLVGLSSNDRVDKLNHMIERRLLGKKNLRRPAGTPAATADRHSRHRLEPGCRFPVHAGPV
jgi:hypothetical protein